MLKHILEMQLPISKLDLTSLLLRVW